MNVEAIDAQKSFLGLSFSVEFRDAELLQSISRQITIQEVALFLVLLFSRRNILLKWYFFIKKLVCRNKSLSYLFLFDTHSLSSRLIFAERIRIQHLHFCFKSHIKLLLSWLVCKDLGSDFDYCRFKIPYSCLRIDQAIV